MFDTTINMGTILQILTMIIGGGYFLWQMKAELAVVHSHQSAFSKALEKMDQEITILSNATVDIARQDERMNAQDSRLQELSNRLDLVINSRPKVIKTVRMIHQTQPPRRKSGLK